MRVVFWALVVVAGAFLYSYLFRQPTLPAHFEGHVERGFEAVEHAFRQNFENGLDPDGAAFAVCHKGRMVVDLWGGYADKASLRKWKGDTMTMAMSVTKAVTALCIARLVDQGYLKYDDLVTKYWPEFGANGKENVTVKMLISHQAGLVAIDEEITMEAAKDWRKMSTIFEQQRPNWPPGTDAKYHVTTFGFFCDQLLRRVDPKRRSIGEYFREEIAVPFGIDLHIGLPRDQHYRVAYMTRTSPLDGIRKRGFDWDFFIRVATFMVRGLDNHTSRGIVNPPWLHFNSSEYSPLNDPDLRELEIAAANGIGTARALAKLFCLLGTSSLLNKTVVDTISSPIIAKAENLMFGPNRGWGYGFMHTESPEGKTLLGHHGYGGQNVKFDKHEYLSFAYLRNNMAMEFGDDVVSFAKLQRATYDSIRSLKAAGAA